MPQDLHNKLKVSRALAPVAATTDNTAYTSQILDTANYDSNEFAMLCGSIADADVTFTVLVEEGNNSGLSDNTTVAAADLIGTNAGTITAGAGDSLTPGFADDNTVRRIGYKGNKRYIRVTITPANNTGNLFLAAVWIQGNPRTLNTASFA